MKRAFTVLMVLSVPIWALNLPSAAPPVPDRINYQGVLRDTSGQPLEGLYDMVFRLFDADAGGEELLVDAHQAGGTGAVTVSRGLFSVALGGGAVSDGTGTGPGDPYGSLSEVFRDFGDIWLEVQVGGETLSPRTKIHAAAYALNSAQLGGFTSGDFGLLSAHNAWTGRNTMSGPSSGVGIMDGVIYLDPGSAAANGTLLGAAVGGSPMMRLDADGDLSVTRYLVAQSLYGKGTSPWLALEDAAGTSLLASLQASDLSDTMWLNDHQNGRTVLTSSTSGIGLGTTMTDPTYTVNAPSLKVTNDQLVGGSLEVDGFALNLDGALLRLRNSAGTFLTQLSANDTQNYSYLYDFQNSRYLLYSNPNGIGIGTTTPINSYAVTMPSLYLSSGTTYGILAEGTTAGGAFQDASQSGFGRVGYADYGGWFQGESAGTYSVDPGSGANGLVGSGTYKILGTGAVSFIQNHPVDADKVIVYAAPEGDEVATYTRGSARLEGGVARVALGETFKWVTNPDIGLTATVTPRGSWSDLYVESVTTSHLLVRSAGGAPDALFDYVVFGLRIGFEESSIVQEKIQEARIPSMADHENRYERAPGLRRFNAFRRFETMAREAGAKGVEAESAAEQADGHDLGAARALREAIGEFDPLLHAAPLPPETTSAAPHLSVARAPAVPADAGRVLSPASSPAVAGPQAGPDAAPAAAGSASFPAGLVEFHPTSESIEAGDVLVADAQASGRLALGRAEADPAVVGVAAAASRTEQGKALHQVLVALAGTMLCKVDAAYGAVRAGDLLTTSPTPGHARVAGELVPGTILGKAIEPLDAGKGLIRVLVMPR